MVKKKAEVDRLINNLAKELNKEIPIREIILYGSYATGKPTADSDIDLVIVSPAFVRGKYIVNMQYLFRKAARINSLLEPIPATPEEIKYADRRTFLGQVKKTGKIYKIS